MTLSIFLSCPGIAVRRTASLSLAYVPGIHVSFSVSKTWMAGTSPAMTASSFNCAASAYATACLAFSARLRSLASRNFLRSRIDFGVTSTSSSSSI